MRTASAVRIALASQDLDQFLLAVAGDAGDTDDLAGSDAEARADDGRCAAVADGVQAVEFEIGTGASRRAALADGPRSRHHRLAEHHRGQHGFRGADDIGLRRHLAAAQDRHILRKSHDFAKLMRDQDRR